MPKDKSTGKKLADMMYGNPDRAAFGITPMIGKRREDRQDREAAKSFPVDLARGVVAGAVGMPGDIESLARLPYELITGNESPTFLPTSEDVLKRIPFGTNTPAGQFASGLGTLAGGSANLGALPRAVKAAPGALKAGARNLSAPRTLNPQAGVFIGPKAKTWNQGKADMAVAMEEARRTPQEIWQATGTFRGNDGILRQEINDRNALFNMPDALAEKVTAQKELINAKKELLRPDKSGQKDLFPKALTEAKRPVRQEIDELKGELREMDKSPRTQGVNAKYTLEHPELYAAYPELMDIPIVQNYKLGALKGSLTSGGGKIYGMDVNDVKNPRSVALHEMQHAVQSIEGMSPGASPMMAFSTPEWKDLYKSYKDAYLATLPEGQTITMAMDDQLAQKAANRWYELQYGEAEARAVQARKDKTAQERAESFPYNSFDVNPKDMLTRKPYPNSGQTEGGSVHISDNPDVMALELAGGGLVKRGIKAIKGAAESAGQKAPVLAEKDLTTLQDFHTSLGDSVRQRVAEANKMMEGFDYKYDKGQRVFTKDSAAKNKPPYTILSRTRVGNQVMREDMNDLMSKKIIDPETGKAMRTPYEPGYRVRMERGPDDWHEFDVPASAIVGDVEMAGGGLVKGLKAAAKAAKAGADAPIVEAPSIIIPSKISNVKEAIRQSKGEYGAKRVERAADEIKNLERLYKESALREAFGGDNARALMTMNPADFERYAKQLEGRTPADIGPKMSELAKQGEIDKYTVPTDEYIQHLMRLQGGFDDVPYLNLYKDEVGLPSYPEIKGHEGRHRNRALAAQGEESSLVQISPRGDLREGLPRRSQEEFIEALKEELGRSNQLVYPEADPYRPPIRLPEPYAAGGAVKMAAGGLSKLAKLARAPAKTRQQVEAIAERMAPQVTGEYVRESAKSAKTVAGKTQKQFQREKNLPVDIRPTDKERIPQAIDIEKLKGDVMIGIQGDPTATGKTLYSVGDVNLESPSPQHGGPLYGLYSGDNFWASGLSPAVGVQNLAERASKQYDAPVKANYIMMGPESINYAQHFADANLQAIDLSRMTKDQVKKFNELIRFGSQESGPRPSFPGIEDKGEAYLYMAMDPKLRKHFNALMQMPTVTENLNLPSGTDIRFAITEPALRDLETGVTGFSMGRMRPEISSKNLPLSTHPTYDYDIPGEFMGQSRYPMPYELSFPDTLKSVRENPKQAASEFGSLKMVGPRQTIDQQMIDEIKMYEERMKALTGKKKGGAVRKAAGGEITADDLILEERKL